jgi:hypothetical protein
MELAVKHPNSILQTRSVARERGKIILAFVSLKAISSQDANVVPCHQIPYPACRPTQVKRTIPVPGQIMRWRPLAGGRCPLVSFNNQLLPWLKNVVATVQA